MMAAARRHSQAGDVLPLHVVTPREAVAPFRAGRVLLGILQLQRNDSPLSPSVWTKIGPQLAAAWRSLATALGIWSREGLSALQSG